MGSDQGAGLDQQNREGTMGREDVICPVMVATAVTYCVTHQATDHDNKKWNDCRFRQLFYFENPMDEHTVMWSDEIGAADA